MLRIIIFGQKTIANFSQQRREFSNSADFTISKFAMRFPLYAQFPLKVATDHVLSLLDVGF